jgi:hypothetical protein
MKMSHRTIPRRAALLAVVPIVLPLASCVTVESPDKPIEINLNVDITQEVLVRLQQDARDLIQQNPDAFPKTQPPGNDR